MAGLEGRLGGLIADVRNLAGNLSTLVNQVREDHDLLNPLPERISELKKQIDAKLVAIEKKAEDARSFAETELVALRKSLEEGVNKRGERWFHVIMAFVGVVTSLLGAYLTMKFGLSGGGSSASHGH